MPKQPSKLQSLKSNTVAVWKKDWTSLAAKIQIAGAAIWGGVLEAGHYLNNDTVKGYLSDMKAPQWVFLIIAGLGLMTYLSLGRENDA